MEMRRSVKELEKTKEVCRRTTAEGVASDLGWGSD